MNYSELYFEKHKSDDMETLAQLIGYFQTYGVKFTVGEGNNGCIKLFIEGNLHPKNTRATQASVFAAIYYTRRDPQQTFK